MSSISVSDQSQIPAPRRRIPPPAPRRPGQIKVRLELVIIAGCLISMITFGIRSDFGLFTKPISDELGWGREVYSLAIALQNLLWGVFQPIAGAIADRYGTARTLAVGAVIYVAAMIMVPYASTPIELYLTAGILAGIGIANASFAILMTSFARAVPESQRSWVLGIATAAGSLGQFVFVPIGQGFINAFGWQWAMIYLAFFVLLVLPLAWPLRGKSEQTGANPGESDLTLLQAFAKAFAHPSYILLMFGFFVCGFHVAFIAAHLPADLVDHGLSASAGAWCLAIVGFFNIIGAYSAGVIGGKLPKQYILSVLYFGRAVAITAFVMIPVSIYSAVLFSGFIGLFWFSTVPLTAGLVAAMFGTRYMGTLFGFVFLSHQVGSFIGVWLGGKIYDATGSYDMMWWAGVAFAIVAMLVHLPIKERLAPSFAAAPQPS
ncbi:MAG: MFS transporter [Pseudomonadota bacterium]